MIAGTKVRIIW